MYVCAFVDRDKRRQNHQTISERCMRMMFTIYSQLTSSSLFICTQRRDSVRASPFNFTKDKSTEAHWDVTLAMLILSQNLQINLGLLWPLHVLWKTFVSWLYDKGCLWHLCGLSTKIMCSNTYTILFIVFRFSLLKTTKNQLIIFSPPEIYI